MALLKQSTAYHRMVLLIDSADHVAGKTGLTLTITASKAGAAFASITPTVTERGNGWYDLAFTTTHTNTLGELAVHITATGADPFDMLDQVIAADLADTARLGLTALPSAAAGASGGLPTGNGSGQVSLDLTQAVPTSNTAQTVGDALNAARAQGFGKWAIVGTTLTLYAADGTTAVRVFTFNDAVAPTART